MRNISLAFLALSAAAILYGCAEKKEAAETKGAQAPSAASVSAPLAGKNEAAPALAPAPEVKPVEKKAPAPVAVKTLKNEPAAAVREAVKEQAPAVKAAQAEAPRDVQAGMALFKAKCSPCHGAEGKGTTMAPALKGNDWVKTATNGEISEVILKGRQGKGKKYANFFVDMPATRGVAESDVAALTDYLRSLN